MSLPSAVITGTGCICAAGDSLNAAMSSIYSGIRSPSHPEFFNYNIEKVSPVFEITSTILKEDKEYFRTNQLAKIAVQEALQQANLNTKELKHLKIGVILGTTVGCTVNNEPYYREYRKKKFPPIEGVQRYLNNNTSMFIAKEFECNGPVSTIANACSSGTDAIGLAKYWIENGVCDLVIAGGADELCRTTYLGFSSLLITSEEPCKPFDRFRKGLNLGEGAGIVIVEGSESANRRGANILAQIKGYGCSSDAHHPTAPHPEGTGLRRALTKALQSAGVKPDEIAFVNAHGTSTPDNDRVEGKVIHDFFRKNIPVVSTKAYTGHTLGAAGGIEAVFTIRGLHDQMIPATAGFNDPDDNCGIVPTRNNTPISGKIAVSNSLGFGGNNSVVVIGID